MEEVWKPLLNWPGYEVSNKACVRSYRNKDGFGKPEFVDTPHPVTVQTNKDGYKYVMLMRDGKQRKAYIHHLMGEAFIPNPEGKPEINHENGIKDANDLSNFTWMTHAENMEHARRTGLIDKEKMVAAVREACHREVYCYEDDKYFYTAADAADYYNVSRSLVTLCCQGKVYSMRGLHLCYAEDADYLRSNIGEIRALGTNFKRIKAINVETGEERIYPSRKAASADLKIPDSYISNIIAGRSYKTRGWTFKDMPANLEKR